jgi:hypothetical protein
MIANTAIPLISITLLVYWFRYTCLLLIELGEPKRKRAEALACANNLSFVSVRDRLARYDGVLSGDLCSSLDRDYRYLICLLKCARVDVPFAQRCMVALDYAIMKFCYRVSAHMGLSFAQRALGEMAGLLAYFSASVQEQLSETT